MCGRNRKGEGKLNTPLSSSPHPGKMSPPPEGKSLIQRPGELPSAGHASGRPSGLRAAGGGPSAKATEISVFVLFRVFFFFGLSLHSYQVSRLLKHLLQTYWGLGSPGTSTENHTEEGEVTLPPGGAYLRGSRPWVTPGALP